MRRREVSRRVIDSGAYLLAGALSFQLLACSATTPMEAAAPRFETASATPVEPSGDFSESDRDEGGPPLQPNDISAVVLERYSSIGGCHTIQYSGSSESEGALTLAWLIQPDGSVTNASVVYSSFDSAVFHDCVLAIVRDMRFPASNDPTEVGAWEISFAGRDQHSRR